MKREGERRWLVLSLLTLWISVCSGVPFTKDFETGDLRGWYRKGEAFSCQPVYGDNVKARGISEGAGLQGKYWIGTYERRYDGPDSGKAGSIQGDGPRGRVVSETFTVTSDRLSFLVGGGSSFRTRVELQIEVDPIEHLYRRVLYTSGRNREKMERVVWNLSPYRGKRARVAIVDDSSERWGHINVDDFRFYDVLSTMESFSDNAVSGGKMAISGIPPSVTTKRTPRDVPVEKERIRMPDFHGWDEKKAREKIVGFGLEVGKCRWEKTGEKEGTVIRQYPAAGTMVRPGERVDLWLASFPERLKGGYAVWLKVDKREIKKGESVTFRAEVDPVLAEGSYFFFRPGDRSRPFSQKGDPVFRHRYLENGSYRASVEVRFPDGTRKSGGPVEITVLSDVSFPGASEGSGGYDRSGWIWLMLSVSLMGGGVLWGLRRRFYRRKGRMKSSRGVETLPVHYRTVPGEAEVSVKSPPVVLRWSFRAIPDGGVQRLLDDPEVSEVKGWIDAKA
ncbi:PASTA domain-containing protein [Hydrogenimonas sp.]